MPDLALVLQHVELAELVRERDLGVDPVQLEQVDPLQAEVAQAQLDCWRRYSAGRPAPSRRARRG